jgi:translation initiation factor 4E
MAGGYYSNHSRLPSGADAPARATAGAQARSAAPDPPRPRAMPSSRHFSTSVEPARPPGADGGPGVHPLRTTCVPCPRPRDRSRHLRPRSWVFWYRQQRAPGDKIRDYEEGLRRIGAVSSAESFWRLQTHLAPPSALAPTTDVLLFHAGVRRPVWEDPANARGGKWILRLRKGIADRLWEDLLLAVVGDQFPDADADAEWPEICGASISVRLNEDIISLWNREADPKTRERIKFAPSALSAVRVC